MAAGRLKQKFVEPGLAIGRICPHVTQVAAKLEVSFNAMVIVGINAAVERTHHARAMFQLELLQCISSSEGKDQIELRELAAAQILDLSVAQVFERNRSIQ